MNAGQKTKFLVIGSGGGGGTLAWMLAKAGHQVTLLEQGPDLSLELNKTSPNKGDPSGFNSIVHSEEVFRLRRPDPKRRLRGDYNTFRMRDTDEAKPFRGGWTGSSLGGGSVIWGTWAFRALPIDFKLASHLKAEGQLETLTKQGYSVVDWPVDYQTFVPFYKIAEALFAVNGDHVAQRNSIEKSAWYGALQNRSYFKHASWFPDPYPGRPFPRTPVGQFVFDAMEKAGMKSFTLPTAIVSPDTGEYSTRAQLNKSLAGLPSSESNTLWQLPTEKLWSDAVRSACNMCGYCGEYICWAKTGAKSGTQVSTIAELKALQAGDPSLGSIITNAKVHEVLYDANTKRGTGANYLDITDPDKPKDKTIAADYVVVSGGAVQSARLLLMSLGASEKDGCRGLGNASGQVGKNVCFHMFGFGITTVLNKETQGLLHSEYGPTGNTATFAPYFLQNPMDGTWVKVGTLTSTAKKNPMEGAIDKVERENIAGMELMDLMVANNRTLEIRCTSDDLPMPRNCVDLDPSYVDEYGFPVARITRDLGPAEWLAEALMEKQFLQIRDQLVKSKAIEEKDWIFKRAIVDLVGDHQMGTCRMGSDPTDSVLDQACRLWDAPNVFVVDASFMPSGLGLNPMMTVLANALRVGSWMIKTMDSGGDIAIAAAPAQESK